MDRRKEELIPCWGEKEAIRNVGDLIYEKLTGLIGTGETIRISENSDLLVGLPYNNMAFLLVCAYLGRKARTYGYIFVLAPTVDPAATNYDPCNIVFNDFEMKLCHMTDLEC